jgi:hypothetical protein
MAFADREFAAKRAVVIANPTDDDGFVSAAEGIVAAGVSSPEALEAELRKVYPGAVVREREISAEPIRMWYAYRDGHWVDSRDDKAM